MKTNSTKVVKQISFIMASEINFVIKINSDIIAITSIISSVDYIMMVGYTIMQVDYCIVMVNYIMANYIRMVSCIKVVVTNINLELFI